MNNLSPEVLDPVAREATRLLKAMAHPSRLLICCQLREGEMAVGQIELTLGIRQPNLSRELARLREDGIVATRRESRVVFYRLQDPRAHELIDAVCAVMLGGEREPGQPGEPRPAAAAAVAENAAGEAATPGPVWREAGSRRRAAAATPAAAPGAAAAEHGAEPRPAPRDVHPAAGYGLFARTGTDGGGGKR